MMSHPRLWPHVLENWKLRTTILSIGALNENLAGDMTSDPNSEATPPPSVVSSSPTSERGSGEGDLVGREPDDSSRPLSPPFTSD